MSDESQAVAALNEYLCGRSRVPYGGDIRTVLAALAACRAELDALREKSARLSCEVRSGTDFSNYDCGGTIPDSHSAAIKSTGEKK